MPAGDLHAKPELSLEARKRLLLVACTIDRLHLLNKWKPPPAAHGVLGQLASSPWLEMAVQLVPRFLPRKLRMLVGLVQAWGKMRGPS